MAKRKPQKHTTISQLLSQTAISKQLETSSKQLQKVCEIWENWPDYQLVENCQPIRLKEDELIFLTPSSVFSSKLRHSQKKVISFLNQAGIESVKKITVTNQPTTSSTLPKEPTINRSKPSEKNISLLSSNANSYSNEKLKLAATQLARTLKKLDD